jgi:hypothetical protein
MPPSVPQKSTEQALLDILVMLKLLAIGGTVYSDNFNPLSE